MADVRTMKLNLLADVADFTRGIDKADRDSKGLADNVDGHSKKMSAAFAAAAAAVGFFAIKLGVDSVKAAAEDEASQTKLATALKNVTGATDDQIAATEKYIEKQQRATGINDTDVRTGLARLVRSTKDVTAAQKLFNLALDISAGTGKDVTLVTEALAKANDGNLKGLKKLGLTLGDSAANMVEFNKEQAKLANLNIDLQYALDNSGLASEEYSKALEKVTDQQEKVNAVQAAGIDYVGELTREFGGSAAAAAATFEGKLKILNTAVGELKEGLGAKLIPTLVNVLEKVNQVGMGFAGDDSDSLSQRAIELGASVGDQGAFSLGASLKAAADAFSKLFDEITSDDAKESPSVLQSLANGINAIAAGIDNLREAYAKAKALGGGLLEFLIINPGEGPKFADTSLGKRLGYTKRAAGGPVTAGQAYRVGEFGPEMFVPAGSGSIRKDNGGGGGNTVININGVIDAESARRSIEKLLQNSARRTGPINLVGATL